MLYQVTCENIARNKHFLRMCYHALPGGKQGQMFQTAIMSRNSKPMWTVKNLRQEWRIYNILVKSPVTLSRYNYPFLSVLYLSNGVFFMCVGLEVLKLNLPRKKFLLWEMIEEKRARTVIARLLNARGVVGCRLIAFKIRLSALRLCLLRTQSEIIYLNKLTLCALRKLQIERYFSFPF